ncbi:MAG: glycogen debranching protein, partial [Bacteroidota bacterium]
MMSLVINACTMLKKKALYSSPEYILSESAVVQGNNRAVVVSPAEIKSNYTSPASATFSRLIKFKFSINEKDNEMAPGDDHWVFIKDEHESPVAVFGQRPEAVPEQPASYLPTNYSYTFRADMRPVLKQFEEKGYYEAYDGSRITKADFKGFYIAGAAAPLSWDFVNLANRGMKMEDADGDGIYTITIVINPYKEGNAQERSWKLQKEISGKPAYQSEQPIVDALYNLSLEEALTNIEADSTFRTGAEWG